ncbi:MAG TPA: hypothetical protein VFY18_00590, partial [Candidatus Limnocylindrales bacterium]|nr:hypothetical protein [Candidatus Limnocylindrales bacterium]
MHKRSLGLTLFGATAIIVGACGGGATPTPAGSVAASQPPASTPAESSGASPSTAATSTLKIGLVTDVGTLDDKNFNQFSWEGAQDGAAKIGAPAPKSAVSQVSADIAKNIQAFVD